MGKLIVFILKMFGKAVILLICLGLVFVGFMRISVKSHT